MKRRWLMGLLVLTVLGAFAVWLEPTRVAWGWLCGEAFFRGRPTSYWARSIAPWKLNDRPLWHNERIYRVCDFQEPPRWLTTVIGRTEPEIPAVLCERSRTCDVLQELATDSDPNVRAIARIALDYAMDPDKAPPLAFAHRP